jgi:hypothetical protein
MTETKFEKHQIWEFKIQQRQQALVVHFTTQTNGLFTLDSFTSQPKQMAVDEKFTWNPA